MRYPHEKFVLAQIAGRNTGAALTRTLHTFGLEVPSRSDLLRFEEQVYEGQPKAFVEVLLRPERRLGPRFRKPYLELMRKLGLEECVRESDAWKDALALSRIRRIRMIVEAMLLSILSAGGIATVLADMSDLHLTPEAVLVYRDFFFNPERMNLESWRHHFEGLSGREAAIKRAIMENPADVITIRWKAGLTVKDAELGGPVEQSKRIQNESYLRLMEGLQQPDRPITPQLVLAANLFFKAAQVVLKYGAPEESTAAGALFAEIERIPSNELMDLKRAISSGDIANLKILVPQLPEGESSKVISMPVAPDAQSASSK